jgi:transposase
MPFVYGASRDEVLLFPEALNDYITAENPVRFIDAFVSSLDLSQLGFNHSAPGRTGRPPYDPADLLRLYIYGYLNRVRSSRMLERETHRNLEVMWLVGKLTPDHKTIANFRKDNPEALKRACREFTLLCKRLDLFAGELVAVDGSKFRADNSRQRNYNEKKLDRLIKAADEKIISYLKEMDEEDHREPEVISLSAEELKQKLDRLKERKARYEGLQTKLKESGEKQLSTTDPDSRLMLAGASTEVCYNVQTAVDSRHKLILEHEVTQDVTDKNQLYAMSLKAKEALGAEELEVVADMGYFDGAEVKKCQEAGITTYVAKPYTSANQKHGLYTKDQFSYDKERDCYICPEGEELSYRFDTVELGRHIRYYATTRCRDCPARAKCTRAERGRSGRRITRWVDEHLLEEMAERVRAKPEVMKQRKAIVEHPYGTMKRGMNQAYFLLRGLKKVAGEMSLTVLAYNMKRVLNIVGVEGLMEAVG